jgi:Ca2+-binding EF-hand superfamily protein
MAAPAGRAGPLTNFVLDERAEAAPAAEQIMAALSEHAGKVLDLFRSWDDNSDGQVTRAEFCAAMRALGLKVPRTVLQDMFSTWDNDNSGILTLSELTSTLRAAATVLKNLERLRDKLSRRQAKATQLFREWDENGDGKIELDEFKSAIRRFDKELDDAQLEACFRRLDRDGNRSISLKELKKVLSPPVAEMSKAERAAARKAREEEARKAHEEATREKLIDIDELRRIHAQRNKRSKAELQADEEAHQKALQEMLARQLADEPDLTEEARRRDRERRHMSLRLRGTEMPPHLAPLCGRPRDVAAGGGRLPQLTYTRPRHTTRLPQLKCLESSATPTTPSKEQTSVQPRLLDVLSLHRQRSFGPARRHCEVTLPPAPAKLSRSRLTELKRSRTENELRRYLARHASLDRAVTPGYVARVKQPAAKLKLEVPRAPQHQHRARRLGELQGASRSLPSLRNHPEE